MQKLIQACTAVHDNLWAFLVCVLAAFTMLAGIGVSVWAVHHYHSTQDMRSILDPIAVFAGSLITIAAAMFHSSNRNHAHKEKTNGPADPNHVA
jgi:hypothetical protein